MLGSSESGGENCELVGVAEERRSKSGGCCRSKNFLAMHFAAPSKKDAKEDKEEEDDADGAQQVYTIDLALDLMRSFCRRSWRDSVDFTNSRLFAFTPMLTKNATGVFSSELGN